MDAPPTRAEGLARLAGFAPRMGAAYAQGRNTDRGPGAPKDVSALSPWIRHRLVTEAEAIGTALAHHGAAAAERFIAEVFWRTYWKGWLELRPGVWAEYRARVAADRAALGGDAGLRRAEAGYELAAFAEDGRQVTAASAGL
jgi:deoxyribodipyrimidine photo-lyase